MTRVFTATACILGIFALFACMGGPARAQSPAGPGFLLGPGDVVHVSVWNDESLSRDLIVRPDGKISFPLIGEIAAAGRGIDQLRQDIQTRISEYVPNSPVTVILTELESTAVYVVGKVEEPGRFVLKGPTRVMQAIAMAGGLTPYADEEGILVLREVGGAMEAIAVDYAELAAGRKLEANIALRAGDTIVVP